MIEWQREKFRENYDQVVVWLCDVDVQLTLFLATHPYCPCVFAQPVYFAHPSIEISLHSTDQDIIRINYLVQTGLDTTSLNLKNIDWIFSTSMLEWSENEISGWIWFFTKVQLLPKVYRLFGFNLYLSISLALICGIYIIHWAIIADCVVLSHLLMFW